VSSADRGKWLLAALHSPECTYFWSLVRMWFMAFFIRIFG